ncbi:MAG: 16S rRNA (cytidine(1402)-2'-O)-methyltransferase [Defluviitaleaceae bacterium]|nr:16S rRNA (cytidine(1402)-2'-O)-methyltransferase [Defluviitaleaceae bacterium]MCL2262353.1 16S rRNA (cytidine(1402)-2'-O)-methyltransferase [Defluviitaleaceae bacterium]
MQGILYIVATPIGNLEDITARAVRVLGEVDMVAAEDTRHSRGLLAHFGIKVPLFSCHKFNEGKKGNFFVGALLEGKNVALVSDAGTPCISDPGNRLVEAAASAGITVVPVCGVSAVVAALSVSGFEASRFAFLGFLPRGKALVQVLSSAFCENETIVFYESPKRISATVGLIEKNFPTALICLCNDISKKFEMIYRGTAAEIATMLDGNPSSEKGEYTCVVNLAGGLEVNSSEEKDAQSQTLESQLVDIMVKSDCTLRDASRKLHEINSALSKKEIYSAMLRLKEL